MELGDWKELVELGDWGIIIQAIATVALVFVTWKYVRLLGNQIEAANRSAEAAERSLHFLTLEHRQWTVRHLHRLREEAHQLARECKKHIENPGRITAKVIHDPKQLQKLREIAERLPPTVWDEVVSAHIASDRLNKELAQLSRERHGGVVPGESLRPKLELARVCWLKVAKEANTELVKLGGSPPPTSGP